MGKISVSIDDELEGALRAEAPDNVSRFVADAVRDALARKQLERVLDALDRAIGPVDPKIQAETDALFDEVEESIEQTFIAATNAGIHSGKVTTRSGKAAGGMKIRTSKNTGRTSNAATAKQGPTGNNPSARGARPEAASALGRGKRR